MPSLFASIFVPPRGAADGADLIELVDGRRVALRPVNPQDAAAARAFVDALSLTSRYRRFHFGLRELSPEASRAMTEIDQQHHVAFAARPVGSPTIVADARYVMRADSAAAEFAIAVADDWQGAGLGRALLVRLAAHARAHGVRCLFGDVLWGNSAMIGLARQLGAQLRRNPGDSTVVRAEFGFDLPGASPVVAPACAPVSAS
ncbi:MAG TPA: GNAT family N-acetyltransferase [Burkholderiaceae bacterium]|nr:GNAT family N-acetyltransferase [Burkholderiaceae bacterium]